MEPEGVTRALENSSKEKAYLKMYEDNTGMMFFRNCWASNVIFNKREGFRRLKYFLEIGLVTHFEYERIIDEIIDSTLP